VDRLIAAAGLACFVAAGVSAPPSAGARLNGLVTVDDLPSLLRDPAVVLLHVADRPSVFEEGHIPGARLVRYGDFAVDGPGALGAELPPVDVVERVFESAGVSDSSHVIIYAQSTVAAARAFFTLDVHGHRRVSLLDGGLRAWRDAGQRVATGPVPQPERGKLTLRLDASRLAGATDIQQHTLKNTIALVDVRPDDEFYGANTMGGAHAAGHIAGARQLTWNSLVGADGRFLPAADLTRRLEAAGAAPGRPVIAYCMVGMRASVVYFVARSLGYDARLYDGSIVDWSRRNLPTTSKE
jgi:thiosulfate/3-mercaptopyruvate sulfurtransferase